MVGKDILEVVLGVVVEAGGLHAGIVGGEVVLHLGAHAAPALLSERDPAAACGRVGMHEHSLQVLGGRASCRRRVKGVEGLLIHGTALGGAAHHAVLPLRSVGGGDGRKRRLRGGHVEAVDVALGEHPEYRLAAVYSLAVDLVDVPIAVAAAHLLGHGAPAERLTGAGPEHLRLVEGQAQVSLRLAPSPKSRLPPTPT